MSDPPPVSHSRAAQRFAPARGLFAIALAALAGGIAAALPIAPWGAESALVAYGALLARWPLAWLVVLPAALPALDVTPWTGWHYIDEPDLLALITVAALAMRSPPQRADFALRGISGAAIALTAIACVIGAARGLALPGPAGGTAIPELDPANALRIAKGFVEALVLLPFLRRAFSGHAEAPRLFAAGMTLGLALVTAAAIWERAMFPGLANFDTVYRIVATFSAMHFGGGYVGGYVAMALPFAVALISRRLGLALVVPAGVALGGLYTLVVTFARTAYASAVIALAVLSLGRVRALLGQRAGKAAAAVPAALLVAAIGIVFTAVTDTATMQYRISQLAPDLSWRLALWADGMSLRSHDAATTLFGVGLGTYARTVMADVPKPDRPGNVATGHDGDRRFVTLTAGQPLYFGERIDIASDSTYRLSAAVRTHDPLANVVAILCEKVMLYSDRCTGMNAGLGDNEAWRAVAGTIETGEIDRRSRLHIFRRPTELAFFVRGPAGASADIADIHLIDAEGRDHVANGDFTSGLARWVFTDDIHSVWRIENQYLMTWFEAGALGVAALLLFAAVALGAAWRADGAGEAMAPAFAASIVAVLASSLFDCPLDVPRLATLFYLAAFAAFAMDERSKRRA